MTRNRILYGLVFVVVVVILFYSFNSTGGQEDYIQTIEQVREETDEFMRTSDASPFATMESRYQGLKYFDPNPEYKVTADFIRLADSPIMQLVTSDGKDRSYRRIAFVDFRLRNRNHRLVVLESTEEETVSRFIPFADSSSGEDTYGGGRYLDVEQLPENNRIELDFNLAYNPYCAYSEAFSCPLPPADNFLAVPVLAGEKNYD